ncbi:hypothetical protein CYLTODRAFT_426024, partial [Cylindrobasidium torrendii FP15055 ss-10]
MAAQLISKLPTVHTPEEHGALLASTQTILDMPPILRYKNSNVNVAFNPQMVQGSWKKGSIYIIDSCLAFMEEGEHNGFRIEYPKILLHGVRRGDVVPTTIHCQLEETDGKPCSLSITPDDVSQVEKILEALSFCASLHEDIDEAYDCEETNELDGRADFEVFSGTQEDELKELGMAARAYLNSIQ